MPDRIRTHVQNWAELRMTLDSIDRVLQALQTSDMSDVSRLVSATDHYILAWNPATAIYEPQSGGDATHLLTAPKVYFDYTFRSASWEWAEAFPGAVDEALDYLANRVVVVTGEHAMTASLVSELITGTAPFVVASTTVCANLNADLLDGSHAAAFAAASHNHAASEITSGLLALARGGTNAASYTNSQLIRMNAGGTAFESSGKVTTDFAHAKKTKVFYIEDPEDGDTYVVMRTHTDVPITITKVFAECDAGTPDIHLWWRAPDSQFSGGTQILTAVLPAGTTEQSTTDFASEEIAGARSIWCEIDDADGATKVLVTIEYTED